MAAAATDLIQKVGTPGTATTLSAPGYTAGVSTAMTVASTTNWPTDTGVSFAVDVVDSAGVRVPGTYCEFVGVVASATSITNVSKTFGTAQNYAAGATTRVYIPVSSTRENRIVDWGLAHANQDGSLKPAAVQTALGITASPAGGWDLLNAGVGPNTVTALGNRSYELQLNGVDLTSVISAGMRLRTTRTVAAQTQSTSLNGTSQYFSKAAPAGMTFTDDFAAGAWVKLSSYKFCGVISRFNGTNGWQLYLNASGQVHLQGVNGGGNFSQVFTYQSLPLNKWVHITAQLDMSAFTTTTTTSYIMIDGVDVPSSVSRGGTNPTALVQAGNLEFGSANAADFFPGKIAQAFVTSAKITQANVKTLYSQGLTSALITANNIISAYSFGNSITDLNTTNANNLTANGGAVATNADAPFGRQASGTVSSTLDYALVESSSFSTNTTFRVRVPEGCTIPTSGGVSNVYYSTQATPYGFSEQMAKECRRLVYIPVNGNQQTTSTSITQFDPVKNYSFTVPSDVTVLNFGLYNTSLTSGAGPVLVFKFYNGAISTANELVQLNHTASNDYAYLNAPVPVVPGETIQLYAGWLTTAGTANWSGGGANRQAPAIWVECA